MLLLTVRAELLGDWSPKQVARKRKQMYPDEVAGWASYETDDLQLHLRTAARGVAQRIDSRLVPGARAAPGAPAGHGSALASERHNADPRAVRRALGTAGSWALGGGSAGVQATPSAAEALVECKGPAASSSPRMRGKCQGRDVRFHVLHLADLSALPR